MEKFLIQQSGSKSKPDTDTDLSSTSGSDSESNYISKKRKRSSKATKKYDQKFRQEWLTDSVFMGWLQKDPKNEYKCKCKACDKVLVCGKSELLKHSKTNIHKVNVKKTVKNLNLCEMLDLGKQSRHIKSVKEAEIKLCAFFAEHNVAYYTIEHLLPLLKSIFTDSKIAQDMHLGRTKCINIVKNVISVNETTETVNAIKCNKFSILVDESTDISVKKMLCCLVRYVNPRNGRVQTDLLKLIEMDSTDCTAEKIYESFINCLNEFEIPVKNIIGYASDGANVMIGAKNSFKSRLINDTDLLISLKCICHSGALVASKACLCLPRTPEDLIRSVSTYITSSAKRSAELTEIQQFLNNESHKMLKLSITRWLCLHQCVVRILENWEVLIHFFTAASFEDQLKQGDLILSQLKDKVTKSYFLFLQYSLNYFNSFNALFQSKTILIHKLSNQSKSLYFQIQQNFIKPELVSETVDCENPRNFVSLETVYLGPSCESFLEDVPDQIKNEIRKKCLSFYITACVEIKKRLPISDSFFNSLMFIDPTIALYADKRNNNLKSLQNVSSVFHLYIDKDKIESEWRNMPFIIEADTKIDLLSLEIDVFWHEISKIKCFDDKPCFTNIALLAKLVLTLPHSNADAERVFSIVNDIKTKKRNKLSVDTLNSMCVIRTNFSAKNVSCTNYNVTDQHLKLMNSNFLYEKKTDGTTATATSN